MSLEWKDKVNGVDDVFAEDINNIAQAVIALENTPDSVTSVNNKTGKVELNKSDIGLDKVDNTSDSEKPISILTQMALNNKVDKVTGKGLSDENYSTEEKNKLAGIESGAQKNAVNSVSGKTGDVVLSKSDVGLNNVDNTSDMDKPVSNATQTEFNNIMPINKISVSNTKTVVLPNLKGGKKIKALHIGHVTNTINSSNKLPVILKSKSLIDLLDIENWIPKATLLTVEGNERKFAYIDISDFTTDELGNPTKLYLSFAFNESIPGSFRIVALKKDTSPFVYTNLTKLLLDKDNIEELNSNIPQLDFSLISEYLNGDYIIAFACYSQTYIASNASSNKVFEQTFFSMWLSRFKYLQLENGDEASRYNLGDTSTPREILVTLNKTSATNTYISEDELTNLYLDNSGAAELIINTDDTYVPPSDIYVEYYEDASLKYQKMESDLQNKITEATALTLES